jgi:hypothetical protein
MTIPAMNKLSTVFPIMIDKYEQFIPNIEGMGVPDKINAIIQYLNRIGKLSNDVVADWNKVMVWVMDEGLNESVIAKVDDLIAKGTFDTLLNGMFDVINADVTAFENSMNNQMNDFKLTTLANIGNGSPKGTYSTVTALQTAYPTGTTGIYVVTADGGWYYWSSTAWTKGGTYQSTGISSGSITYDLTKFLTTGKNLFNRTTIDSSMLLDNNTGSETSNSTYSTSDYIPVKAGITYAITKCRKVVLYNSQKTYASGYDVASVATTITPNIDGYMRVSFYTSDLATSQVEVGSTNTTYAKYGLTLNSINLLNSIGTNELSQGSVRPDKTSFLVRGKNMFNPSNRTIGIFLSELNGNQTSSSTYDTSEYIPVTAGTTYAITKCRKAILFNLDKTFVQGYDVASVATTVTPSMDGYMRVSFYATDILTSQIEIGSSNTNYEAYNLTLNGFNVNSIVDKTLPSNKLKDGDMSFTKTNFFTAGKNLFNKDTVTLGFYKDASNGNAVSSANYDYSDYIPVKTGITYAINTSRKVTVYDSNKNVISAQGIDNSSNGFTTVTPSQDGYIIVSLLHSSLGSAQVEIGSTSTAFEQYGMKPVFPIIGVQTTPNTSSPSVSNSLSGKTVLNFGDSIAAGDGNSGTGYAELIASVNGMSVIDRAVGGATVRVVSGSTNNLLNQINNSTDSADYILMDGLTNDATTDVVNDPTKVGSISSGYVATLDTSTFCGAFESMLKTVKTKWMGKKILYVCVHKMPSRDTASQDTLQSLARQMCQKWSVPFEDLYNEGGLNTYISAMQTAYSDSGGTHPNADGYNLFYVPRISSKMKLI